MMGVEAYERAIKHELGYWPGVQVAFGKRSKHREAVLHFQGATRFIVYPDTPGDAARGHLNCLSNVRKELRELGAERLAQRPKKRKRVHKVIGTQKPQQPSWTRRGDPAPVKPDPFAALQALSPVTKEIPVSKESGDYLFEFEMGGVRYSFAMYADDMADARRRLLAIQSTGKLSGGPCFRIPANAVTLPLAHLFAEVYTRIRNALKR